MQVDNNTPPPTQSPSGQVSPLSSLTDRDLIVDERFKTMDANMMSMMASINDMAKQQNIGVDEIFNARLLTVEQKMASMERKPESNGPYEEN